MKTVMGVLDDFCQCSGQRVKVGKSAFLCSSEETIHQMVAVSGFTNTDSLGKYLGVPLSIDRRKRQMFKYLEDKVCKKLSS